MSVSAPTTLEQLPVVDVDSHVIEPPDLWTSRLPKQFSEQAPHVVWDESARENRWQIGDVRLHGVAYLAMGGWREPYPFSPGSLDEAHPAAYDADARVAWLDAEGIAAQVLYPNLLGFDSHAFLTLGYDAALACVQAYNDYMTEWCSAAPKRLIPIMNLPFWDLDEAERELIRCHEAGHRGVLMAANYEKIGFPNIADPAWARILQLAEDRELSINFHIGFSKMSAEELTTRWERQGRGTFEDSSEEEMRAYVLTNVRNSAPSFLSNAAAITDVIVNGLCARYPRLKFVSVESGFGYVPFLLQALDWQWTNARVDRVQPDLDMLPSEYFKRQIYATFWYERPNAAQLEDLQDRVMFETDFPHPTSLTPGPWSAAAPAKETIRAHLSDVPLDVARKVLYGNAAELYHLDLAT